MRRDRRISFGLSGFNFIAALARLISAACYDSILHASFLRPGINEPPDRTSEPKAICRVSGYPATIPVIGV